jgi:hypothetical protein
VADLNSFDLPLTELEAVLSKWTQEAVEMRYGVAGDPDGKLTSGTDDSPAEAVAYLRRVRQRADRVGELLAAAKRARGRARRALAESAFATDNEVATGIKKQGRVEFQSHREREVEAKLDAFESRRIEHQAKRLVSVADEAVDVISDMHWSLDAIRKDLRSTLHALQFEASLER